MPRGIGGRCPFRGWLRRCTKAITLLWRTLAGVRSKLRYVCVGNVAWKCKTACQGCGRLLIRRRGFSIVENRVYMGRCPSGRTAVAGLGLNHFSPA